MPLLNLYALLRRRDRSENGVKAFDPVGWQLDGHADSINEPAQDDMARCPAGIAFAELLDGSWLLARRGVRGLKRPEDLVQ
jgi:hypothetical protein